MICHHHRSQLPKQGKDGLLIERRFAPKEQMKEEETLIALISIVKMHHAMS